MTQLLRRSELAVPASNDHMFAKGIVKLSEVGAVANHISLMRHI
ncbi:MAG TPA: hypothetical protein VEF72_13140 [Mycobacterium sp.]|nr:hypothetical protein [Mycobacterium sp.]